MSQSCSKDERQETCRAMSTAPCTLSAVSKYQPGVILSPPWKQQLWSGNSVLAAPASRESSVIFNWWSSSVLWKHVLSEMWPGCTPLIHAFIHSFYVPDRMWSQGNELENKTQCCPSRFWLGRPARIEMGTGWFGECRMGFRCPGSRGRHVAQSRKLGGPCPPCQAGLWVKQSREKWERMLVGGGYRPAGEMLRTGVGNSSLKRLWVQALHICHSNKCNPFYRWVHGGPERFCTWLKMV